MEFSSKNNRSAAEDENELSLIKAAYGRGIDG